jgi:hypothetical protein
VLLLALLPEAESDCGLEPEVELGLTLLPSLELDSTEELVLCTGAVGVVDSVGVWFATACVDPRLSRDAAFVALTERVAE